MPFFIKWPWYNVVALIAATLLLAGLELFPNVGELLARRASINVERPKRGRTTRFTRAYIVAGIDWSVTRVRTVRSCAAPVATSLRSVMIQMNAASHDRHVQSNSPAFSYASRMNGLSFRALSDVNGSIPCPQ